MSDIYSTFFTSYLRFKANLKKDLHFKFYKMAAKEQWLEPHKLEQKRLERLRKLLSHAINNSAYYQKRFTGLKTSAPEISSLKDLLRFPLLKREDLQEDYRKIFCPVDDTAYQDSSGGSTGEPVNFYHDNYYKMFSNGLHLLFLSWIGVSQGDRTAVFWGAERDFGEASLKERLYMKLERVKILNSFNVDDTSLDKFLSEIEKFKPDYIYGYSSSLELAATYINKTRKFVLRPKAIRSTAEMLYDVQRTEIEKAFQCPVYNFYGSREVNNIAAECSAHEGLHVFASGRIIEVVDEKGNPLPSGEIGYMAVTDLTNFSFPFIRYLNGDMASMRKERCSCGRSYPLLENVAGREYDILTFGGKYIHGQFFPNLFYQQPDVKQFQVIQEADDHLVIKVVAPNQELDIRSLLKKVRQKVGEEVKIDVTFVDKIPVLKSGKYRFTINNSI